MYDLRSLPFGWKLSPPICRSVLGTYVRQAFDILVSTMGNPDVVEYDHCLDDVLVVWEGPPQWPRDCMISLAKFMQAEGYLVLPKSVLEPGKVVKWPGKEVDLVNFTIANLLGLQVKIVAYLVKIFGSHVSVTDLQRVMGLINCTCYGTPPLFWGGVYCAVAGSGSGWLHVTRGMWLALVSAMLIATPPFCAPDCYVRDWLFVQWISVDAAEFMSRFGVKLYRIGIFDPAGGARALVCPQWVDNQQVAELYGFWMMLKVAVRRKLPQVLMLQDNVAAFWAAVNLGARAPLRQQNRILRAIVMLLRRCGVILHSTYVPSAYQSADPISRLSYFSKRCLELAAYQAQHRWDILINNLHYIECKGAIFLLV